MPLKVVVTLTWHWLCETFQLSTKGNQSDWKVPVYWNLSFLPLETVISQGGGSLAQLSGRYENKRIDSSHSVPSAILSEIQETRKKPPLKVSEIYFVPG